VVEVSVFTFKHGATADEAAAYVQAVLELLGDLDPVEVLSGLRPAIEHRVKGVWEDDLVKPEADGKWSMMDTILHLLDSEVVLGTRLRSILAEDRPILTSYDQDLWSSSLTYDKGEFDNTLRALFGLRRFHVRLIQSLTPEQLERVGVHYSGNQEESLRYMIPLYAGHDMVHLRQLERIRKSVVEE